MKKTILFIAILLAIVPFVHATKVWTRVTDWADIQENEPIMLVMEDNANNRWILKFSRRNINSVDRSLFELERITGELSTYNKNNYVFFMYKQPEQEYVQLYTKINYKSGFDTYVKSVLKNVTTDFGSFGVAAGDYQDKQSLPSYNDAYYWLLDEWDDTGYFKIHTGNIVGKFGAYLGFNAPYVFYSQDVSSIGLGPATPPINQWATNQTLEAASTGGNMAAAWSIYKEVEITEITLNEDEDNSSTLSANAGKVVNATVNRTLSNSSYNTFTLPFDVTADEVTSQFGTGTEIYALSGVSSDATTGAKILTFGTSCTAMAAGKPYLVKPANNTTLLSFTNKTIVNTATEDVIDDVHFVPVFSPTAVTADANHLFLGQNDLLYHPVTTGNIPGLRGYFYMGTPAQSCMARIGSPRGVVTKLHEVQHEISAEKLIRAHQLIIRVNGHTYNAQGAIIH